MSAFNSILFFDSDCLMCNYFVQRVYEMDKKEVLYFSDFNSEKAKEIGLSIEENTMVLYHRGEKHYRSTAFLKTMDIIENRGLIVRLLEVLPKMLRDFFYNIIARNRNLIKSKECNLNLKNRVIK